MPGEEQRRTKADLLLEIHENGVLIGCINAKFDRIVQALDGAKWGIENGRVEHDGESILLDGAGRSRPRKR